MLRQFYRCFYKNGSTLSEISAKMQHAGGGAVLPFTLTTDHLYIAQYLPFNNFFALIDVANEVATATLKVEYFDGRAWREAVDVIDTTEAFQKTGAVQFTPDRQYGWANIPQTDALDPSEILSTLKVYDLYWVRVSASEALDLTTAVKRLGYAFCMTEDLSKHEPEIDNYLAAWAAGKADWYEQIMVASEQIVNRLKEKQFITGPGQILRFDDVSYATQMQTLINIYTVLGPAFNDRKDARNDELKTALSMKRFSFDQAGTADVVGQLSTSVGELVR